MKKQQKRIARFASLVVILALVLTMNVPNFSVREVHAEEAQTFKITTDRPMLGEAVTTNADQGTTVKWYIDDHMVSESKQYIPDESALEKWITAKAYIGDEQIGEDKFYFSKLPVIYINTDDSTPITTKETYVSADMFVQGNKQYEMQYNGRTQIKLRGNISTSFEQKPYKLKLEQSTDMFGFGKNKHWVLLSNYVDQCSLRNKISTELGEKLGVCSMKATQVDVIINGEFAGMYNFFEQIRVANTRVNIKNWEDIAKEIAADIYDANKGTYDKTDKKNMEDELCADLSWVTSKKYCYRDTEYNIEDYCKTSLDISGGYLFEMSEEYDEVSKFTTSNGIKVMLKSPENLYTNESMMDYVKSYWNDVEEALSSQDGYNTKGQNYKELVDVDSMVAYWLTQEIMGNNDAQEKSRFAYKDTNGKLVYGPIWDFDWGGGSYTVGDYAKEWVVSAGSIWNTFIDDPYFQVKAIDKYWSVRDYLQSIVEDDGILDQYYELLKEAGAANDTKYQEDSFYGMLRRNFDTDFQTYKTYFKERLAWLDEQFASYQSLNISLRLVQGSPYPYVKDNDLKIRFQNVQEDTQSKIKADGVIASNKNLNLNIEAANADQISVYVNADKVYEQKIEQGKVQYTLPKKLLTEEYGTKNVIAVIAKNSAGVVTATNYVTIIVNEAADEDSDEEEETTITVKYMDSDGSYLYAPQQIKTTEKVNKPEDPVKNGYQFVGWYCDTNFEQEYDFTSKPEKDVDLYAKWKANDYTITYHLDGGKNDIKNPTSYTINDGITFLNPTRTGYTFEGWYSSSDFKTKVMNLEKGSVGAIGLYAKWTVNDYAITYHLNGGKNDSKNPASYTINDSITFSNPTRTGYTFEGWYTSSDFKTKVLNLEKGNVGAVDLYAKWTVNDYTITYHLDGGKNNTENPASYTINDSITFSNPTRTGYIFTGWYTTSYKKKVTGIAHGTTGDTAVYAMWKTDPKYVYLKYAKVKKIKTQKYTGKKKKPNVVITLQGKKLRKNKDYKLTYSQNVKVGKAKIKITGKGKYKGTRKVIFRIKKVRGKR